MKHIRIYKLLISLVIFSSLLSAEELSIPFVVKDACPFEGCAFGMWEITKNTPVYKKPNIESDIYSNLVPGTKANVETGILYVVPGKAKVIGEPYRLPFEIKINETIYILDYIGEGYSRIFYNGIFDETKIARTKERCSRRPNWRYCWVEVLEEPKVKWWVKVKDLGWVFMEGNPLKPIDAFSQMLPYNKALQLTPKSVASHAFGVN